MGMRHAVEAIALAAGLIATASLADAQDYPSRDIHLISGSPAGSGADIIVRWVAEKLRPLAGRTIIVENRVGASGNIAVETMVRSKPDGHTIMVSGGTSLAANTYLFKKLPFDVATQVRIAATTHRQAVMIGVAAHRPWKTLPELTAHLKERGDKASYGTSAVAAQVLGETYKFKAGINPVQILYSNAQNAINDLASNHIDFGANDPVFSLAQQRAGRIRILGISTPTRLNAAPDLATMKEGGVDIDLTAWWAAKVPMATPMPIVERINQWFATILATEEARQFFATTAGGDPMITTIEEAEALKQKALRDWGDHIRLAKIEAQ